MMNLGVLYEHRNFIKTGKKGILNVNDSGSRDIRITNKSEQKYMNYGRGIMQ